MLIVLGDYFLFGRFWSCGLGGAKVVYYRGSKLHVEDWRRSEFLKLGNLDPGWRSSFVFPLLFGKRALLVFGLNGIGNLGVDLS